MTDDEIFLYAVDCLRKNEVNTSLTTFRVDVNWLACFARTILAAAQKHPTTSSESQNSSVVTGGTKGSEHKKSSCDSYPPPGCIDHDDMLRVLWARRQFCTLKEIGDAAGVHPTIVTQVLKGKVRVPPALATLLGFERLDRGKESWFRWAGNIQKPKFNLAEEKLRLQSQSTMPDSGPPARNLDGSPRVIRSSPFDGAPKIRNPGPFQQLLDKS